MQSIRQSQVQYYDNRCKHCVAAVLCINFSISEILALWTNYWRSRYLY